MNTNETTTKIDVKITIDSVTFNFTDRQIVIRGRHNLPGNKKMAERLTLQNHQELCDTILQIAKDKLEDSFNGSSAVPAARD